MESATTIDQSELVNPREVSEQLGVVLNELRYLRERILSARESCLTRSTRKCVAQLLTAMESHQKLGEQIADAVQFFTGDTSQDDGDAALHEALKQLTSN